MFKTRLISGIFLVAIALAANILGGPVLFCLILAISLIGMHELYQATGAEEKGRITTLTAAGYIGAAAYYALLFAGLTDYYMAAIVGSVILTMVMYVFAYPKYHANQAMTVVFGVVYVAVMLSYIYRTRCLEHGEFTVWLIIITAWGCDTCAYCAGRLFGKHKMAPVLSPKKTVEGAIGGVIGAAVIGAIYALAVGRYMGGARVVEYALIGFAGGLISMVGDLGASAIKRNHEIKDYGHLIPGHGGILDRFDSVIFTAPIIYYLAFALVR